MSRLTEISAGVLVATGDLYVTNSTIVADGSGGCLVIDPAVTVAELAGLAEDLRGLALRPRLGFATQAAWVWCWAISHPAMGRGSRSSGPCRRFSR